jgi:hypothetical protein
LIKTEKSSSALNKINQPSSVPREINTANKRVYYQFTTGGPSSSSSLNATSKKDGGGGGKGASGKKSSKVFLLNAENAGLSCPFCHLSLLSSLDNLLKHLRNTHFRFNFAKIVAQLGSSQLVESSRHPLVGKTVTLIEVSIDDLFDGSYSGMTFFYFTSLFFSNWKNRKSYVVQFICRVDTLV